VSAKQWYGPRRAQPILPSLMIYAARRLAYRGGLLVDDGRGLSYGGSARARRAVEAEVDRVPQRLQPDWLSQERGAGEHARSDQRLSRLP
jgi:hypothetical protein